MSTSEVSVGLISPSAEVREVLRLQVAALGSAGVNVDVDQYPATHADRSTRKLLDARPDIIIVDMQDAPATIQALEILHVALPETWMFVSSSASDPQLIIDAMRAGAREYLLKPIPPRSLSQAIGRYQADRQRQQQKQDTGKLYCVTAVKGGAGATSVAINLAATVAAADTRVALLDLNAPMGDAAAYLDVIPRFTLTDVLASAPRLDSVLLESYLSRAHRLAVLPGPKELWTQTDAGAGALGRVLDVMLQSHTHVIVDLPSSLDKEHLRLVTEMAAGVALVLTPELPALWRAQRLLAFLAASGSTEKVHLVLNRSHRSDEMSDHEIEKALGHPIYWKLPNNYSASIKAINTGRPAVTGGDSDLAASYAQLAHRLTGIPLSDRKRGLFGLFALTARPSNV